MMLRVLMVCILLTSFSTQAAPPATSELSQDNLVTLEKQAVQNAKQGHCVKTIDALLPQSDRVTLPSFQILARCLDIHKKHNELYRILKARNPSFKDDSKLLVMQADATVKKAKKEQDPYEQNKLNTEAIQIFRDAIAADKAKDIKSPTPYEALLRVLQENNSKYETRELLREMIEKFGEKPAYLTILCTREALDGYLVQAKDSCQKAIDKNPKDEKAKLALVQVLFDQKEEDAGMKLLEATAQQFAGNDEVQYFAGHTYFKKNNFLVAKRFLQKAVALAPNKAQPQLLLGKTLVKLKEDQEALGHFVKACKIDPLTQNDFQLISSEVRQRSSKYAEQFSSLSSSCNAAKTPASL